MLSPGLPVCVARGSDLTAELAYGNHPTSLSHGSAIHDGVFADAACGRTLVFDLGSAANIRGLRLSPLAVVLEPKLRIVHDLTFEQAGWICQRQQQHKRLFRAALRARQRASTFAAEGSILASETR